MDCWSGAKILCDFWDTKINTDNIILTTRYRSEDIPGFVADPEEIKKYAHELVNNAHMAATDNKIRDTILINQKFDYLYAENGRLKAVVVDKNGEPQVTDVTPDKPYSQSLITDGKGDTLVVSKKGQVMGVKEYKFAGDDRHLLNEYHRQLDSLGDWQINFNSAKEKQTYAFDQIGSGNHGIFATDEYYHKSGSYDFRYKSVECGKNDKVIVDFGAYPDRDSVIFKDKYGVKLKVVDGNILTFTGVSKADTNYIYAYRGDQKIGKLFLNTYQKKTYKVVFVRVNGAAKKLNAKEITKYLNKVYNQCAVSFEDSIDNISIDDLTSFSHGGSGVLTVYNDDQKKVLQVYDKEKKMKDGVFYLFFIDNVTDKKDGNGTPVSGYMPRGYNAGFIYDGGSEHTIAHELGHGIAGLEHVFENSNASGKTANLMDYANGEELWHFQWDQIQDPSRVWMKWNKEEEEGEYYTPKRNNWRISFSYDAMSLLEGLSTYYFIKSNTKQTITIEPPLIYNEKYISQWDALDSIYWFIDDMKVGTGETFAFDTNAPGLYKFECTSYETKISRDKPTEGYFKFAKDTNGNLCYIVYYRVVIMQFYIKVVDKLTVSFSNKDNYQGEYLFDIFENEEYKSYYKKVKINNEDYYPPYLIVSQECPDNIEINASLLAESLLEDNKICFYDAQGNIINNINCLDVTKANVNTDFSITIPKESCHTDSILLYDQNKLLVGELYTGMLEKVYLQKIVFVYVYSNQTELEEISKIDEIDILNFLNNHSYNQCGIKFQKMPSLKYCIDDSRFNETLIDRNAFYNYLCSSYNKDRTCFYLFISAKNDIKDPLIGGNSSFEKETHNCILICKSGIMDDMNEIVVHEIGHSYGLQHPFDKNIEQRINKFNSHNFMDYSKNRNSFWKWQVKLIRSYYE